MSRIQSPLKFAAFLVIMLLAASLLSACGSSRSTDVEAGSVVLMEIGEEYQVIAGDVVEPDAVIGAQLDIRHVIDADGIDRKYVVLLSGSAYFHAGPFLRD